jgi:hypothetical protein
MLMKVFGTSAAAVLLALASTSGHALMITPSSDELLGTTNDSSNLGSCEAINIAFGLGLDPCDLELHYKANVGDPVTEEGPFADDYTTTFLDTVLDPSGASIVYDGPDSIDCPECYLLVKDGNQEPAQYLFDLNAWNGTDTLELSGFWPDQGAISNVAIWSGPSHDTPVPGPVALIGLGALLLRRFAHKAHLAPSD